MKSYNNIKVTLILGVIFYSISSCKISLPRNFSLQSPANNTVCLKGDSVNISTAKVVFTWSLSKDAEYYQLAITNLTTNNFVSFTTTSTSFTASLPINAYYSWKVVATNTSGNTSSDNWLFFLSGTTSNYAPFPADLTAPANGATVSSNGASTVQVTLSWSGSDPDNDIASYAVFLDNSNATTSIVSSQTSTTVTQTLASGKIWYWKVITTDNAGNTSTSEVSSFQVK